MFMNGQANGGRGYFYNFSSNNNPKIGYNKRNIMNPPKQQSYSKYLNALNNNTYFNNVPGNFNANNNKY